MLIDSFPQRLRFLAGSLALVVISSITEHSAAQQISVTSAGPDVELNERVLEIPGDPNRPVLLQATLFMPPGRGPFPLAVINHGANGATMKPADQPRYRNSFAAYYFLSRGYAVVLPMMRGYAGSAGKLTPHGCNLAATGWEAAQDIGAVIDYMRHQPGIDGSRVVVSGQSFGGWNTLAAGTLDRPEIKALVNFAGGVQVSDCAKQDESLVAGAALFGAHTRKPSIWFYGDNDKLFRPAAWHAMYDHYRSAGGPARLVAFGTFKDDAHQMLGYREALPIWVPKLDAFLAGNALPYANLFPAYLPAEAPPPSRYAEVDDVENVPYLNQRGRAFYLNCLQKPLPRVITIAPNGAISCTSGGYDPITSGLKACRKDNKNCQLYAVDQTVVWSPDQHDNVTAASSNTR